MDDQIACVGKRICDIFTREAYFPARYASLAQYYCKFLSTYEANYQRRFAARNGSRLTKGERCDIMKIYST